MTGEETQGLDALVRLAPFALIAAVFVWALMRRRRRRPEGRADRATEAAARAAVEARLRRGRPNENAGGPNDGAPGEGPGGDGGRD
ncbi:hypothetical protein P2H44_15970 [Albimonas sp. CAU 1670]|uniref:hypothetical protein n=1 Tax=Albimonas sp. CAU 1670 TaxID=3032599 RepID=UPI0023DA0906|nr:hypothetical protein [Albimonas sp. CAU 1670]MDF2234058.1 hypothetical protein [Albimonas sp. CAU 1670]